MITLGKQPIAFKLKKEFKEKLQTRQVPWGFGGLSEFTFYRTYARRKDNDKLETWAECVIRVIEGMFSVLKTHAITSTHTWDERKAHKLAEEAAERLFTLKWTPPGRGLWMMGTSFVFERGSSALNNCGFVSTQHLDFEMSKPFAFLMDMSMLGCGIGFDTKGAGKVAIHSPIGEPELIIVEDTREGWVEAISCLIDSYMEEGSNPVIIDTSKVRSYGIPIRGFGGVASGPEPLIQGFEGIKDILEKRAKSSDILISSVDITDIMNIIGKIVVAGNVRRSAEIVFGDPDDSAFTKMKDWSENGVETGALAPEELKEINEELYNQYNSDFNKRPEIVKQFSNEPWAYKFGGWRWASNNSIFAEVGMDYTEIAKQIATNGEPGLAWLSNMQAYSRMKDAPDHKDHRARGSNPCITGDSIIATKDGLVKVNNLVGKQFEALVDGKLYNSTPEGFWSTGIKPTYEIKLENGMRIEATSNHQFLTPKGWEELGDLSTGDTLVIANNKEFSPEKVDMLEENQGYAIGQIIGDGTFSPEGQPILTLWIEKSFGKLENYTPYRKLQQYLSTLQTRSDFKGLKHAIETETHWQVRATAVDLHNLTNRFGVFKLEKKVPEEGSYSFLKGLLSGIFDADGSIQGSQSKGVSIRITQTDLERLIVVQKHLSAFGITSKIYENRRVEGFRKLPDSNRNPKDYYCQAVHELIISNDSLVVFRDKIGFYDDIKRNKLDTLIFAYKRSPNKAKYKSKIVSITPMGEQEVFDCTIDTVHKFSANGIIAHNCVEQTLEPYELCCLVETYPSKHDSYWDYQRTLKFAYLYGKAVTLIPTHWAETNDVIKRNRRIGTSQSGIQEAILKFGRRKYLDEFCDQAYQYVRYLDKKYSEWMGVPQSIKSTSIKPSGTVSLIAGVLPGIHYAEAEAYYRLVRVSTNSELLPILKAANYKIEPAASDPVRTSVVYFPVLHPEGIVSKSEVSIWEQFANAADLQEYWADNQVSITITFKQNEKNQIARALSCFDSKLKGISLLPLSEHGYEQAPYTAAPREEIQAYADTLLRLDFSSLSKEGENAESNKFCDGDSCLI